MSTPETTLDTPAAPPAVRPRLWPGIAAVALMAFAFTVPGKIDPRGMIHFRGMMFGVLGGVLALLGWWVFFSRTRRYDRIAVTALFVAAGAAVGYLFFRTKIIAVVFYGAPIVGALWVLWLLASLSMDWPARRAGLLAVILLGWASLSLVRINTISADMVPDVRWFWVKSAEESFMEGRAERKGGEAVAAGTLVAGPGDWTAFRGPNRDAKATGARIRTDWDKNPPKAVWRQRVGPGWGSFCIVGDRLFTQEQHLEREIVACYNAGTGAEIWTFGVDARFEEAIANAGPRATPTFHEGRIYSQGATGTLACLDAASGKEIWTRDIGKESSAKPPQWGFAASPLIIDGKVISVAGGEAGKGVVAYDAKTGEPAWANGTAKHTYSSAQEAEIEGVRQVLVVSDIGLESFRPADGKPLWKFDWVLPGINRVVQPAVIENGLILLGTGTGGDKGTRLVRVTKSGEEWKAEAGWTAKGLKPYYNDFVLFDGHAYGFDDAIFTCVNLKDGKSKWKEGRYGHGQVLLLPDQKKLLVLGEKGQVVLLEANPAEHVELGSFQAIEGRTWNHPVVVRGKLYVRNGEEMACYDLAEASQADGGK